MLPIAITESRKSINLRSLLSKEEKKALGKITSLDGWKKYSIHCNTFIKVVDENCPIFALILANGFTKAHTHSTFTECIRIHYGELSTTINAKKEVLMPDMATVIPANAVHGVKNNTHEVVLLEAQFIPEGESVCDVKE